MVRRFLTAFLAGILIAALGPCLTQGQQITKPADMLAKAEAALQSGKYEEAIKDFKRARGKDKPCADCSWGLAQAYYHSGEVKKAIEYCEEFVALSNDPQAKARAHNLRGSLLYALAGTDARKLRQAEQALRQAVELDPALHEAHYNLGMALLKQSRDDEGVAELKRYLEAVPEGSVSRRARRLISNPHLAREDLAPDFSLTTPEGRTINLDDLRGKVVVVDFWATWCQPCVDSLPSLQKLYREFSGDSFVLLSVSIDRDQGAWQKFVGKEELPWPQLQDSNLDLFRRFRLTPPNMAVIPSYVILDREGVILRRYPGEDHAGVLESDIKKALAGSGGGH